MAWPRPMAIVEVFWVDSYSRSGWEDADEMLKNLDDKDIGCLTVGYLLRETDDRVTIIQSQAGVGNIGDAMTIPKRAILEMSTLKARPD